MKWKYIVAPLFLLTLCAYAQEKSQSDSSKAAIEPVKTEVSVTATRSELPLEKTPVSASIVTQQETQSRNIQSLDQSLNLQNGIYVMRYSQSGSMNKVMMRGFDTAGRTLILLDGQPINDGYNGGVSWTTLPVGEVEQVEVARGSFSSLYGGSAMGGVINIRTRPVEHREFEGMLRYGSNGTANWSMRAADRFFDRLSISTAIDRNKTNGYVANYARVSAGSGKTGAAVTGAIPTLTSAGAAAYLIGDDGDAWSWQEAGRIKSEYVISDKTLASFQYMRQESSYGWSAMNSYLRDASGNVVTQGPVLVKVNGVTKQLSLAPSSFLATPGGNRSNFFGGSMQHQFNKDLVLHVTAGAIIVPLSQYVTPTSGKATASSGTGVQSATNSHSYWGEIQANWQIDKRNSVMVGTETRQAEAGNASYSLSSWLDRRSHTAQTYEAHGQTLSQAVFAQDQFSVTSKLLVIAGARYDYWRAYDGYANGFTSASPLTRYNEKNENAGTWKFSGAYSLPLSWTIHASVGASFRPPMVYELYQTWTAASGAIYNANPDLSPENMISEEVGLRKYIGKRFDADVTYFHNHITDLIYRKTDLTVDPSGKWLVNVNAGAGDTDGIEFAANARILSWLKFKSSYTYTEAVISSNPASPVSVGKRVTNVPKHMGSGALFASRGRWAGSLSARYVGSTYSTDANTDTTRGVYGSYGPYFLMDGGLSFQVSKRWQLSANADNLLDRRYFVYYQQPGRIATVGVRFRY